MPGFPARHGLFYSCSFLIPNIIRKIPDKNPVLRNTTIFILDPSFLGLNFCFLVYHTPNRGKGFRFFTGNEKSVKNFTGQTH